MSSFYKIFFLLFLIFISSLSLATAENLVEDPWPRLDRILTVSARRINLLIYNGGLDPEFSEVHVDFRSDLRGRTAGEVVLMPFDLKGPHGVSAPKKGEYEVSRQWFSCENIWVEVCDAERRVYRKFISVPDSVKTIGVIFLKKGVPGYFLNGPRFRVIRFPNNKIAEDFEYLSTIPPKHSKNSASTP